MSENIKKDTSKALDLFSKIDWEKFLLISEQQLTKRDKQSDIKMKHLLESTYTPGHDDMACKALYYYEVQADLAGRKRLDYYAKKAGKTTEELKEHRLCIEKLLK